MSDHEQDLLDLNRVLNRVVTRYYSCNSPTLMNYWYTPAVLNWTAFVLKSVIDILSNDQTMYTDARMGSITAATLARIHLALMFQYVRNHALFPLRLLEVNFAFGVPSFMTLGLFVSGFRSSEIRNIIENVVYLLDYSGETISSSFVSDSLLQRVRRRV
jgi:hypothetical protein